jgi:hypothetical protein
MRRAARSYSVSRPTSSSAHNTSRTFSQEDKKGSHDGPLKLSLAPDRDLLSAHELPKLLDEAISEEEQQDMDLASAVCQRFLEWDLETQEASIGEVRTRLVQVLGRSMDYSEDE